MNHKKSFTLIEMLIVVVIIGILATALIPRIQDVSARARDTKRKADIRTISTALELYFQDNNAYPMFSGYNYPGYVGGNYTVYSSTQSNEIVMGSDDANYIPGTWLPELEGYLTSVPIDPINTPDCTIIRGAGDNQFCYVYSYGYVWGANFTQWDYHTTLKRVRSYDLQTILENAKDPDVCSKKQYGMEVNLYSACTRHHTSRPTVYDYSPNLPNENVTPIYPGY